MSELNLVDEPWIPCIAQGGHTIRLYDLHEVLARSNEIKSWYYNTLICLGYGF